MQKISILVVGGAGYIGSHMCKRLKRKGYNPIVFDNLSTGFEKLVKWGEFVRGDIKNKELLKQTFKKYKIDVVMHFAAYKSVPESIKNPYKYYDNNVAGTNNLLKTMVDFDIKHFIFSSSAAIFGLSDKKEKVKENDEKLPINPYGKSKLMVESILDDYDMAYNLKSTCLRYFNVLGSDPDLEIGDMYEGNTNIVNSIFRALINNTEFVIYGDDYDTFDGTCIRDYIHVEDLVEAHILALEKQIETNESIKINLGNGNGFSVKEIVNVTKKIAGINFKVKMGERRAGDSVKVVADSSLAKEYLNWNPRYVEIEKQILHSWNWFKKINKL